MDPWQSASKCQRRRIASFLAANATASRFGHRERALGPERKAVHGELTVTRKHGARITRHGSRDLNLIPHLAGVSAAGGDSTT